VQQKAPTQTAMKWMVGGPNCKFFWQITALFLGVLLLASCGTDAKEPWEEVNPWDAALSEIEEQKFNVLSFDSSSGFESTRSSSVYVAENDGFRLLYSDEAIIKYAHMLLHLHWCTFPEWPHGGYEVEETEGYFIRTIEKDEERDVCLVTYAPEGFCSDMLSIMFSMKTGEVIWYGYG